MATNAWVLCQECGNAFELSVRVAYEHRRREIPHRCLLCRGSGGPTRAAVEQAKRWWLERYSLDELRTWPTLGA